MSEILSVATAPAVGTIALPVRHDGDAGATLAALLAGHRRILCAIDPDAVGRAILRRVSLALTGRECRLGIISAARFELPVDALACVWPTPLDRRARLIVDCQRRLDRLVGELGLRDAEVFATAGTPSREIRDAARLWQADIVLYARSAGTGLRSRRRHAPGDLDIVALDDDGRPARRSAIARLFGG